VIAYFLAGGPVMWPILLCSVVALAAFLERMWALRASRIVPRAFCIEVIELLRQERYADALTACRTRPVAIARLLEVVIDSRSLSRAAIKERVEELGRRETSELESNIAILGTIASVGPLLGLLGTVSGMIGTFEAIEAGGMGNMGALAGGIGEALITTFAGLVVAIPALVGNRYLLSRVDSMTLDLEEVSLGVLDLLKGPELAGADEGGAAKVAS
jgi:biopolymer transport protein ExbB